MIRLLFLKMFREIRRSAGTYGVCILIIAIGFCGYSVLAIASDKLTAASQSFYRQTSFPDAIAEVESAPLQAAKKLLAIEGVERVEGRLTATLRVAGLTEADSIKEAELKLFSLGPEKMALPLLSQGQMPREGLRELAIGDNFMAANSLKVGQDVELVVQGRKLSFTICGGGLSPENIYMLKSISDMLPDPAGYDAGFISYDTLSKLLGKPGMANEFLIMLKPGAVWEEVKEEIRNALEPYGCYQVYPRKDQSSVAMLEMELEQLVKMTLVVPFLFLMVAAVILYISLHRMVQQQRLQIGCMLAIGLKPKVIRRHYLGYGAAVGFAGGLLGILLGYAAADPMVEFYRTYFSLPDINVPVSLDYMVTGPLMATVFCAVIGWLTAFQLGNLMPAETLRPPAPKAARQSFLEKIPHFLSMLTVPGIMALRGVARNRRRSLLSIGGIAMAYMITATLVSMYSMFDIFLFDSLEDTQKQDISIHFERPVESRQALSALRHPAVEYAEGIIEFGGTLKGPQGKITASLQGINRDSRLFQLYDEAERPLQVQERGIVISTHMANSLGVGIGDYLELELEYPRKRQAKLAVTGVAAQYIGSTAYLSHEGVRVVSDYGGAYTTVLVKGNQGAAKEIAAALDEAQLVSAVTSRQEKLDMYRDTMGNMNGIMASMAMVGVIIGLAVVYVSSLISFEELKREIAVMMALGMKSKQCLEVVSVEQGLLTVAGIILGIPLTMWMSELIAVSIATDMFTIPSFVDASSLFLSVFLILAAVWISGKLMHRKIKKIAPVVLLRERE
ncbi:MAG: FtsX-like permease family protein [Clostridiales bacterium]